MPDSAPSTIDLRVPIGSRPRLLVSVRSAAEAECVLDAGVDLLDCKEPMRGALGRPAPATLRAVIALRNELAPQVPVSVALGELADWRRRPDDAAEIAVAGAEFAKLGLQGLAADPQWPRHWARVRRRFADDAPRPPRFVAVAYVDAALAQAPPPDQVIAAAIEAECAGVLFDTATKNSRGLLQHASLESLHRWLADLHAAGLFTALAGQLRTTDLPKLAQLPVDVVAVRSAVCDAADRSRGISPPQVRRFIDELDSVWPQST